MPTELAPDFDACLCYPEESRSVARLLNRALSKSGEFKIWFPEHHIEWGASLTSSLASAVERSRHVILIISPDFFKGTDLSVFQADLAFMTRRGDSRDTILPIRHRIKGELPGFLRTLEALKIDTEADISEVVPRILAKLSAAGVAMNSDALLEAERRSHTARILQGLTRVFAEDVPKADIEATLYTQRGVESHIDFFLNGKEQNLFVIAGMAGAGKSTVLNNLGRQLLKEGKHSLIFLKGGSLSRLAVASNKDGDSSLGVAVERLLLRTLHAKEVRTVDSGTLEAISKRLVVDRESLLDIGPNLSVALWKELDSCAAEQHIVIIFDAVNESPFERPRLRDELKKWLQRVAVTKNVKVILSCRHEDWNHPETSLKAIFADADPIHGKLSTHLYRISSQGHRDEGSATLASYGSAPLGHGTGDADKPGAFSDLEFSTAWEKHCNRYNLRGNPILGARSHLKHPLHLYWFCVAHEGDSSEEPRALGEIAQADFWTTMQLFVQKKRERISEQLYAYLVVASGSHGTRPAHHRGWLETDILIIKNALGEVGRFAILSFAKDLYCERRSVVSQERAAALFLSYIKEEVNRSDESTTVGRVLRRYAALEEARVGPCPERPSQLPRLLECFSSERLVVMAPSSEVSTGSGIGCRHALEIYYEYCLGRYLASECYLDMMLGHMPNSLEMEEGLSKDFHPALRISRLLDAHLRGRPNVGEALRYAVLARDYLDADYIHLLKTMATCNSRFHGLVSSCIPDLALIKLRGPLKGPIMQRLEAMRLAERGGQWSLEPEHDTSVKPIKGVLDLYLASARVSKLVTSDPNDLLDIDQEDELESLVTDVLEEIAHGGDFVSRFELQSALATLAQAHREETLPHIRRWMRPVLSEKGWTKDLTKALVAIETLPEFGAIDAPDVLKEPFNFEFGEDGYPLQMRFWIWRAAIEAMTEVCRRGIWGSQGRWHAANDTCHPSLESEDTLRITLASFIEQLSQASQRSGLKDIELGLLYEGIARLTLTGLAANILDQDDPGGLAPLIRVVQPNWNTVATLLAVVDERFHLATLGAKAATQSTVCSDDSPPTEWTRKRVPTGLPRLERWLRSLDVAKLMVQEGWQRAAYPIRVTLDVLVDALSRPPAEPRWDHVRDEKVYPTDPSKALWVVYSPEFLAASLQDHPECKERVFAVMNAITQFGSDGQREIVYRGTPRIEPHVLKTKVIGNRHLHDPAYIDTVRQISDRLADSLLEGGLLRRLELRPGSFGAAGRSAGALQTATQMVLEKGRSVVAVPSRPPGHLATNRICVFDNIATAAVQVLKKRPRLKILIFDADAHHGLHLHQSFYDIPQICYASIHLDSVHPGEGFPHQIGRLHEDARENAIGMTLNLPMRGLGSELSTTVCSDAYLARFRRLVVPFVHQQAPDLTFIAGGVDGIHSDPFTEMGLEPRCFEEVASTLRNMTRLGVVISLEGGYDVYGGLQEGYVSLIRGAMNPRPPSGSRTVGRWKHTRCDVIKEGEEVIQAPGLLDRARKHKLRKLYISGSVETILDAKCTAADLDIKKGQPGTYGLGAGSISENSNHALDNLGEMICINGKFACLRPHTGAPDIKLSSSCQTPFSARWQGEGQLLFRPQFSGEISVRKLLEFLHQAYDCPTPMFGVTGFVELSPEKLVEKHLVRSPHIAVRPTEHTTSAPEKMSDKSSPLALRSSFYSSYFQSFDAIGRMEDTIKIGIVGVVARRGSPTWRDRLTEDRYCKRIAYESPIDASRNHSGHRRISAHVHFALLGNKAPSLDEIQTLNQHTSHFNRILTSTPVLLSHLELSSMILDAVVSVTPLDPDMDATKSRVR